MKTLTKDDIISYGDSQRIDLEDGLTLVIRRERDEDMGPPWEEHDGHGPVSEWTRRVKRAGERVLCSDRNSKRYYDFEAATKLAKQDGWGLGEKEIAALAANLGRAPTAGQIRERAVERDFELMQGWANDEWHWIGVIVALENRDGSEFAEESLWGISDEDDYWREEAAGMSHALLARHAKESDEVQHWAERDTITTN